MRKKVLRGLGHSRGRLAVAEAGGLFDLEMRFRGWESIREPRLFETAESDNRDTMKDISSAESAGRGDLRGTALRP